MPLPSSQLIFLPTPSGEKKVTKRLMENRKFSLFVPASQLGALIGKSPYMTARNSLALVLEKNNGQIFRELFRTAGINQPELTFGRLRDVVHGAAFELSEVKEYSTSVCPEEGKLEVAREAAGNFVNAFLNPLITFPGCKRLRDMGEEIANDSRAIPSLCRGNIVEKTILEKFSEKLGIDVDTNQVSASFCTQLDSVMSYKVCGKVDGRYADREGRKIVVEAKSRDDELKQVESDKIQVATYCHTHSMAGAVIVEYLRGKIYPGQTMWRDELEAVWSESLDKLVSQVVTPIGLAIKDKEKAREFVNSVFMC